MPGPRHDLGEPGHAFIVPSAPEIKDPSLIRSSLQRSARWGVYLAFQDGLGWLPDYVTPWRWLTPSRSRACRYSEMGGNEPEARLGGVDGRDGVQADGAQVSKQAADSSGVLGDRRPGQARAAHLGGHQAQPSPMLGSPSFRSHQRSAVAEFTTTIWPRRCLPGAALLTYRGRLAVAELKFAASPTGGAGRHSRDAWIDLLCADVFRAQVGCEPHRPRGPAPECSFLDARAAGDRADLVHSVLLRARPGRPTTRVRSLHLS